VSLGQVGVVYLIRGRGQDEEYPRKGVCKWRVQLKIQVLKPATCGLLVLPICLHSLIEPE